MDVSLIGSQPTRLDDSGNNQTASIGTPLSSPLLVVLKDASGNPVKGQPVVFRIAANNGTLSGTSRLARRTVSRGEFGFAWAGVTLGTTRLLEAYTNSFNGSVNATYYQNTPTGLFLPTTGPASIIVTSINGTTINENPVSFPDITINLSSTILVVITAHNIPLGTVPTVYVFSEHGDQILPCSAGLQGPSFRLVNGRAEPIRTAGGAAAGEGSFTDSEAPPFWRPATTLFPHPVKPMLGRCKGILMSA